MILPDVNLLLYAYNTLDLKQEAARCWWDDCLAVERGLVLHTTDADFIRFQGLKWKNPLKG